MKNISFLYTTKSPFLFFLSTLTKGFPFLIAFGDLMIIFSHALINFNVESVTFSTFGRIRVARRQGLLCFNLAVDAFDDLVVFDVLGL